MCCKRQWIKFITLIANLIYYFLSLRKWKFTFQEIFQFLQKKKSFFFLLLFKRSTECVCEWLRDFTKRVRLNASARKLFWKYFFFYFSGILKFRQFFSWKMEKYLVICLFILCCDLRGNLSEKMICSVSNLEFQTKKTKNKNKLIKSPSN